jgi:hypothetical protein
VSDNDSLWLALFMATFVIFVWIRLEYLWREARVDHRVEVIEEVAKMLEDTPRDYSVGDCAEAVRKMATAVQAAREMPRHERE